MLLHEVSYMISDDHQQPLQHRNYISQTQTQINWNKTFIDLQMF
jgi:hypothetical protein